jgi:hypothetical protein
LDSHVNTTALISVSVNVSSNKLNPTRRHVRCRRPMWE